MLRISLIAAALAAATEASTAAECVSRSGPYVTPLVELYTSQGCSSCPPAEQWLSHFRSSPAGAVVAIEFHVNYWDSLGWKDRLADVRHTERQRQNIPANGARYLYTPQVVVGGRDMPLWKNDDLFESAATKIRSKPALASISLAPRVAGGAVRAEVVATLAAGLEPRRHELVVVLAEDGLTTQVLAGENRGRELAQDFVARDLLRVRLQDRLTSRTFSLRKPGDASSSRLSVAAFIQDTSTGEVVQALSRAVCE